MRSLTRISHSLALFVVVACGGEVSERMAGDIEQRGIINGSLSHDPTVVLYGCTATIVGPRTVISAAHCFHPAHAANGTRTLKVSGKNIRADFYAHPSFDGRYHDVAIGFTEEDLDVAPRRLGDDMSGGSATITGFGCNSGRDLRQGYGTQRSGAVNIYANRKYHSGYMVAGRGGAVGCPGDSGGPAFQGGALVGVIVRTDLSDDTFITRLDTPSVRNWLIRKAAAAKAPICGVHSRGCQKKQFQQEINKANAGLKAARVKYAAAKKDETAKSKAFADLTIKDKKADVELKALDAAIAKLKADFPKAAIRMAAAIKKSLDVNVKTRSAKAAECAANQVSLNKAKLALDSADKSLATIEAEIKRLLALLAKMDA